MSDGIGSGGPRLASVGGAAASRSALGKGRRARRWTSALRVAVSVVLCAVLVAQVSWSELAAALSRQRSTTILGILALLWLGLPISAWKWQLLLRVHGSQYSLARLHRHYLVAAFVTNFLPTNIGGDAYRIFKTPDSDGRRGRALLAVAAERVTGLAALLLLGLGSALVVVGRGADPPAAVLVGLLSVVLLGAAVVGGIAWLLRRRLLKELPRRLPQSWLEWCRHLRDYRSERGRLLLVLVLSFAFHVRLLLALLWMATSVGASIGMAELAVALVFASVVAVLPISLNGFGLVDGSLFYLLQHYGLADGQAFGVVLLYRVLPLSIALVGGMLCVAGDRSGRGITTGRLRLATVPAPAPEERRVS